MHQKKLKLLCLHGYGTNKKFMEMQTRAIRAELQDIAQFIIIDAPTVVPPELVFDPVVFKHIEGAHRVWFSRDISKMTSTQDLIQCLQPVKLAFQSASDTYDGAFCFSQGAMIFQVICCLHELKLMNWECLRNIKFFMNFSSVGIRFPMKNINWKRLQLPSLHIMSQEDVFFKLSMLTALIRFKNPEVIFHTFGHKFPMLGFREKRKIVSFMRKHGFGQVQHQSVEGQSRL